MSWDGNERRKMSEFDLQRDRLITEMHSDIKHLVKKFDDHAESDEKQFKKQGDNILWLQRVIYMGLGIVAFLQFVKK